MDTLEFPIDAKWVPGKRAGSLVLEDPYGNRLIKKTEHGSKAFYWCFRKDLKCPVRVTLNKDTDQLVGARGEHNHDSAKLAQFIKEKTKEMIENAVRDKLKALLVQYDSLTLDKYMEALMTFFNHE